MVIKFIIDFLMKIKRTGELARKLRFFKEQMLKAGFSPKKSTTQADISVDDLEVCQDIQCPRKNF